MSSDPQHSAYEVLVCTYNGERYIADQLESILKQQPAPAGVLVSDDGSTDQTRTIVKQIAASSAIPVTLIDGPGKGVIQNVLTSLPKTTAPYVFLADQDDIWLDNKASLFYEKMRADDAPHLIFSDAWVWHPENDEKISFWKLDQLNPKNAQNIRRLAFHNTVQGASACVNRSLIATIESTTKLPGIVMHDWWLAMIACGTGRVDFIETPTLFYRQHDNNQVGSQTASTRKKRKLADTLAIANRILQQAVLFSDHFIDWLPLEHQPFFREYQQAMRGNVLQRAVFILLYRPQHRDMNRTLKLWASLLLAKKVSPP